jgi:hypothetical protein
MKTSCKEELLWAVTGEIYGEALFRTASEVTDDPDVAEKCMALAKLEAVTLERLLPLAEKYGLAFDAEEQARRGAENGEKLGRGDWLASMRKFQGDAVADVARMERLLAMGPEEDKPALEFLLAHEKALARFIDGEIEADPSGMDEVLRLIEQRNG